MCVCAIYFTLTRYADYWRLLSERVGRQEEYFLRYFQMRLVAKHRCDIYERNLFAIVLQYHACILVIGPHRATCAGFQPSKAAFLKNIF